MSNDSSEEQIKNGSTQTSTQMASKFKVVIKLETTTNAVSVGYKWTTSSQKGNQISNSLLKLIVKLFFKTETQQIQLKGMELQGLTKYTCNGITYQAHPNYKNESPWFDWVMVAWVIPNNNGPFSSPNENDRDYIDLPIHNDNQNTIYKKAMLIPAKLICIVEDNNKNIFAIIHSCHQT